MTVDVCEEFWRQKPGNSDVISVIMSLWAGALSRERLAGLLGAPISSRRLSSLSEFYVACVTRPTAEQRHTTAPFPSLSPGGAAPPCAADLAGRPAVCTLLAVVKAATQRPTVPRHQRRGHISSACFLVFSSVARVQLFLSTLAWQTFSSSRPTDAGEDIHLPVAAASVPVQPVIGSGANQLYVCRRVNGDAYVSATF